MDEDVAWLRLQDTQREAENRRLVAAGRPSATMAALKRLVARRARMAGRSAPETKQELA